jgi:HAD superfamily hydrolase (TIGR01549 family)
VSFDLDGVLIQNPFKHGVGPHLRAHVRSGRELRDLDPDEANQRIQAAVEDEVRARMGRSDLVAAYDWDAIFGLVARRFGAEPLPDVADLVRHYCGVRGTIWLLDGAADVLERLTRAGVRIVAATNGFHRYQEPVLEALGILPYFAEVRTPDTTGFAKPDRGILAGVDGLVAHVGDMLYHDVLVARRLGVQAIWCTDALPEPVRALAPAERARDPLFLTYFEKVREVQPYRQAHPEVAAEDVHPDRVVTGVGEIDAGWFAGSATP